jgi:hypothetical protein
MQKKQIAFLWEIPLALLSFLFYKVIKFIIGNLYIIYLARNQEKAKQWRVLSQDLIDSPLSLPVLMTKGPRWNTHAIIGTLGPFNVKEHLELDLVSSHNSARSWIAIFYSFPDYQTIDTIESSQVNLDSKWQKIQLKPGRYTIGLRYYERFDRVDLPAIKIDDSIFVESTNVSVNVNDFYLTLSSKTNLFYLYLHYYIFIILKYKKYFSESFIRGEYLPVGATDTDFIYNFLEQKQSLNIQVDSSVLNNYLIYFTLYNRASLPLQSISIERKETFIESSERAGFYLLRLRPKIAFEKNTARTAIDWQIFDENSACQTLTVPRRKCARAE